ncbi:PatB family C-S lyase [Thiomicrospira sp.]|uniref:MalY/PatB family protein n=1 Tax=Thiomicrospira sp. TaxID=935 RepID=UPI002F93951C
MTINFNQPISRLGTQAEKYEARATVFGREDVLPMWVADMDLPTPPFIIDALKQRLNHPILGYSTMPASMFQAIVDWQVQHGYVIQAEQIRLTHNVANGLFLAVQAFTRPGDKVLIQPPIYPPFFKAATFNDRQLALAPLVLVQNQYQIDFVEFERQIQQQSVRLFLLCNPHNPAGRVWSGSELRQMAEICLKHHVIMVSDEIHSDLIYEGFHHTPLASISDEIAQQTITLSSPGKTFNLAGLQIGYAIIANPKLREAFSHTLAAAKIEDLNLFGMVALEAAYSSEGRAWKRDLMTHFQTNLEYLQLFLAEHFPQVKLIRPQASYLAWLDFRELFSDHPALKNWLIHEAKLGLNDGESYGEAGSGFMRMNIAAPQSTLEQAFRQLVQAKSAL